MNPGKARELAEITAWSAKHIYPLMALLAGLTAWAIIKAPGITDLAKSEK